MYDNLLANVPTDFYIGGEWRKSSDNQRFDVIDPATERKITSVASATVRPLIATMIALLVSTSIGEAQQNDPRVAEVVRAGKVRVAFFLPQYTQDAATGELKGHGTGFIGIEIAHDLAKQLGVQAQIVGYPAPSNVVECLKAGDCDVAFMGIEPSRAAVLDFSTPLFNFDYTYLVPADSKLHSAADVDQPGIRIAAVHGHASTLSLGRLVKRAEIILAELPDEAFNLLRAGKVDVLALTRQDLERYSPQLSGSRVMADAYGVNRVGIAMPKGKAEWRAYVTDFVEQAKASGLIQRTLDRGNLQGFRVAPPGDGIPK